jgi:glutathione synthase
MKLLFVADPLEDFKIVKDTTFAMMREAAARGHTLLACEPQDLTWQRGGRVTAHVRAITLTGDARDWYRAAPPQAAALADLGAVVMRKDPPFDSEFFYATHLLNRPDAKVHESSTSRARCATIRRSWRSSSSRSSSRRRW